MVIMDMGTATIRKSRFLGFIAALAPIHLAAAELTLVPSALLEGTYSDNILATNSNETDSFVTSVGARLNAEMASRALTLNVDGSLSRLFYSHDHELDKNFTSLNADLLFSPWANLPKLQITSRIENIPRNTAENTYADLISANTIESVNNSIGFIQNIQNSAFNLDASVIATKVDTEDNLGESEGYQASLDVGNGLGIQRYFWQITGNYDDKENDGRTGRSHQIEVKVGLNTPIKISPFYRFYDEDFSGNISTGDQTTTSSSGAGFRWQVAKHFNIDLSYNFVKDDELSDDYVEATIDWQPSERTSIFASYDQRFFGDSYQLNVSHRIKRLTNTITYDERIEAFERDVFETYVSGNLWCPIGQPFEQDNCLTTDDGIEDLGQFFVLDILGLRPVENNQFTLNKSFSWDSALKLSRTTFTVNVSGNERENLNQGNIDEFFNASLSAKRRMSGKSDVTLLWRFNKTDYNTNNIDEALSQTDYYRNYMITYERTFASSLSGNINLEYRNRKSDRQDRDYDESRVSLNFKKDF